jgi:hypothetical protein
VFRTRLDRLELLRRRSGRDLPLNGWWRNGEILALDPIWPVIVAHAAVFERVL